MPDVYEVVQIVLAYTKVMWIGFEKQNMSFGSQPGDFDVVF